MATPKKRTEAEEAADLLGGGLVADTEKELQELRAELQALKSAPQKTPGQLRLAAYKEACQEKQASIYEISWKRKGHSQLTGEALEKWKTQKMQPREYAAFCKSAERLGLEYKVISEPKNI